MRPNFLRQDGMILKSTNPKKRYLKMMRGLLVLEEGSTKNGKPITMTITMIFNL
jgi:hypothetical protein